MLLNCPQCEMIFCVDHLRLHPAGRPVHCIICDHIWTAQLVTIGDRQDMPNFASYLHKFRLPVIVALICAGLMALLTKGRGILTAYFPRLIMVWACCTIAVRFMRPDGVILNETVIRPDDQIIAANQQSPFFTA